MKSSNLKINFVYVSMAIFTFSIIFISLFFNPLFSAAETYSSYKLYAADYGRGFDNGYLVTVDPVTAEVKDIGRLSGIITDFALSPDGVLYGYDTNSYAIVTIDIYTGTTTIVTYVNWSRPGAGVGIAFSKNGNLYAADGPDLLTIDLSTGNVSYIGSPGPEGSDVDALAFSPNGILYGVNGGNNSQDYKLYTYDLNDGIQTPGIVTGSNIQSLTFTPNGTLLGLDQGINTIDVSGMGDEYLVTIDPTTGTTGAIGNLKPGWYPSLEAILSQCSIWSDVIAKFQSYVNGQATWTDVITCYNCYVKGGC